MRAMVLKQQKQPLVLENVPVPVIRDDEILVKVKACGVCRTDLHIKDGDLTHPKLPLILGHEIVGIVEETGKKVTTFKKGDRVGIPWLGKTDNSCEFCKSKRENLCDHAEFTGYQINGGYAEYMAASAGYAFHLPLGISDLHMAPLMCAGLVGYRAYRHAGPAKKIGFYGFGSAAHILTQIALHQGKEIYAFTRDGDSQKQQFARRLGAVWAGGSSEMAPEPLDAAIIFASAGNLVPLALKALKKGGILICGGIHMSNIPSFPYSLLWEERSIQSIANMTREDGREFIDIISKIPIETDITIYPLEKADAALEDMRAGKFEGSAVLDISK